jgi:ketosteroid isomerase-like protein
LDERVFIRWPGVWPLFARAVLRLPPRARLRRAMLRRAVLSGWAAFARNDLDLMLVRYAPDYQLEVDPEFASVGLRSSYRGHAGLREQTADLRESWEKADTTPLEIVDAGNRLVNLGEVHIRARGSGVELDSPLGQALWIERGLVVRERWFLDWDAALRAADISTTAAGSDPGTTSAPRP